MTRTVYPSMLTHLATGEHRMCTCWQVTWVNGTVLGFTDHDQDIPSPGWSSVDATLNNIYVSAAGYTATDSSTTAALNVDTMEVSGPMISPSITENDVNAGLWDYAKVIVFDVCWADLTRGPIWRRVGRIGEITMEKYHFRAELRGLAQAYANRLGSVTQPGCRNNFGDSRCGIDKNGASPALFVIGAVTSVNPDGVTIYDTGRTEPGPSGGVAITHVTNANPGVVTLASTALGLVDGQLINISGIVGMPLLNVVTVARSPSGTHFNLTIDTTDTSVYGTYSSGGTVDVFGGDTSIFDFGIMTITNTVSPTPLNAGLSREVKCYTTGQITLQEPFPYPVAVGDSYILYEGCDLSETTCHDRYNNVVNFNGEPWLQGQDKLVQVARHNP